MSGRALRPHQSAEKAVKALYQRLNEGAWGHSVMALLQELPQDVKADGEMLEMASGLDLFYFPPRYPNSVPEGAPGDFYTSAQAIQDAGRIIIFCENRIL